MAWHIVVNKMTYLPA